MGRGKATLLLAAALGIAGLAFAAVNQEGDSIIVSGADEVLTAPVSISQGLTDRLASVMPRVVLECANQVRHARMVAPPGPLQTLLNQMAAWVVLENADAVRHQVLSALPAALQARLNEMAARIVLQYANDVRHQRLAYPAALFNDTIAPQITGVAAWPIGGGRAKIVWTTNEFATSVVLYGTQSGVYPHTATDPLYAKQHEIILTGLTTGTRYYYRVRSTDRSGNTATSAEYSFTLQIPVYLPLVLRGYR